MDQQVLMDQIRNGDELAFAELVSPLIEKAYRVSFSILKSREEAEEVMQNAMVEAYKNIMAGKEITFFTTWFYKLVSHRSIDVVRKNSRFNPAEYEINQLREQETVIDAVIMGETSQEIKEGINALPNQDYRNVLLLYYYQNLSIQEVADILGLKTATVKSHLYRARNALKKGLLKNKFAGVRSL